MLTWDEAKRKLNIKNHGLDFTGCDAIWDHFTITREDKRQDYGEARLVCFGLLAGVVVVMVYTERSRGVHVISLRKAEKHETRYYRQVTKENLG
ncbi:BrnT family toxin [Polaromonas sp.]|uniref:BrnT family toxin n=1 Tax=Polaromonas sp. TaxID=1869339 RepID=UPI00286C8FF5|nr:BrnT family toxin [Polaromonas sp.]